MARSTRFPALVLLLTSLSLAPLMPVAEGGASPSVDCIPPSNATDGKSTYKICVIVERLGDEPVFELVPVSAKDGTPIAYNAFAGLLKATVDGRTTGVPIVVAKADGQPDPSALNRTVPPVTLEYQQTVQLCQRGCAVTPKGVDIGEPLAELWAARVTITVNDIPVFFTELAYDLELNGLDSSGAIGDSPTPDEVVDFGEEAAT